MRCRQIDQEILREAAGDLALNGPAPRRQTTNTPPAPTGSRITKPQTQWRAALEPGRSFTSVSSRMIGKLFRERVFQTSFLALLLLSLAIYLGTRAGARTFQREQAGDPSSPTAAANAGLKRAPDAPATTASEGLQPVDSKQNDGQQNASNVFTYIVQPNDTLRALCLSLVGRYDETVQQEIRKLNPNLKDLTHLNPGQEIRLPLNASKQDQPQR